MGGDAILALMKFFGRSVLLTLFELVVLSFAVGLALYFARIDPLDLWRNVGEWIQQAWDPTLEFLQWSARYSAVGAVIVVPIWIAWRLVRMVMGSRKPPPEPQ